MILRDQSVVLQILPGGVPRFDIFAFDQIVQMGHVPVTQDAFDHAEHIPQLGISFQDLAADHIAALV